MTELEINEYLAEKVMGWELDGKHLAVVESWANDRHWSVLDGNVQCGVTAWQSCHLLAKCLAIVEALKENDRKNDRENDSPAAGSTTGSKPVGSDKENDSSNDSRFDTEQGGGGPV